MTEYTVQQIERLTDINAHTEARIVIARQYKYCADILKCLLAIKEICEFEGYAPYGIQLYRNELTNKMLQRIERTEGKEEMHLIYKLI